MGTVGHQRFAMDRSSRPGPAEAPVKARPESGAPPPKASRVEEPPVTGIPMTQLATAPVTSQPESSQPEPDENSRPTSEVHV